MAEHRRMNMNAQTARIAPVKIPGMACGITILQMVSNFVAPRARLASRNPCGMARNDSSVATMTTGRVITAIVADAQRRAGLPQTLLALPA